MKHYDYLIVGGGIAGTTAADTIRKKDPKGTIGIITDEPDPLYSRLMLSKPDLFLGKIPFEKIWLKDRAWYRKYKIDFMPETHAASIRPGSKEVCLGDGSCVTYGKLLLAIGVCARRWNVPGAASKGVHYLRSARDGQAIIQAIKRVKNAVTIGGGFISFEMSDLLRRVGADATAIIRESYFWEPVLDQAGGKIVEDAMKKGGVKILRNAEVTEVLGSDSQAETVVLKDGSRMPADMIACGIGTVCPDEWLKMAGIHVNRGIVANEYLETSMQDVWAAGDVAEFNDLVLGEVVQLGSWANAQRQGMVAGLNMAGERQPFRFVSSYTTHGFGLSVAFVGNVRPGEDREMIVRHKEGSDEYARLFVREGELVGAVLINRPTDLGVIQKIIESDRDLSDSLGELEDPSIEFVTLLGDEDRRPKTEDRRPGEQGADMESLITHHTSPIGSKLACQGHEAADPSEKLKIGWFSFSCCEDNTIVMTEVMNDHWQEWRKMFDFRHVRVIRSKNVFDEMDIAFVEGAIASPAHEKRVKEIREKATKLVAVGACAVTGMPAGQRNHFNKEQKEEIQFLIERFKGLPKVLKVSDAVKVDVEIPGCPMDPEVFLKAVNDLVKELRGKA